MSPPSSRPSTARAQCSTERLAHATAKLRRAVEVLARIASATDAGSSLRYESDGTFSVPAFVRILQLDYRRPCDISPHGRRGADVGSDRRRVFSRILARCGGWRPRV